MTRTSARIVFVALCIAMTACSDGGWTETQRARMVEVCDLRAEGNEEVLEQCHCALDYMEENYTWDEAVDKGSLARAMKECDDG